MSVRTQLSADLPEATQILDSINRWKIAETFSVNRVHDRTRTELYRTIEKSGRSQFSRVMDTLAECAERDLPKELVPIINLQNFDADAEGESPLLNDNSSIEPFFHTMRWLRDHVSHICPFVRPSLSRNRVWLTAAAGDQSYGEGLYQFMLRTHRTLQQINEISQDSERIFNTLIITFPDFPSDYSPVSTLEGMRSDAHFTSREGITAAPFLPSMARNKMCDPEKKTPPVFAFRNELN